MSDLPALPPREAVIPMDMGRFVLPLDTVGELQQTAGTLKELITFLLQQWALTRVEPDNLPQYFKLQIVALEKLHKLTSGIQLAVEFKKADVVLKMMEMMADVPSDLKQKLIKHLESQKMFQSGANPTR